jgi:hypothetical protein
MSVGSIAGTPKGSRQGAHKRGAIAEIAVVMMWCWVSIVMIGPNCPNAWPVSGRAFQNMQNLQITQINPV